MKKKITIAFIVIFMFSSCGIMKPSFKNNSYSYALSKNEYWDNWKSSSFSEEQIEFYSNGNIDHFILFKRGQHPSEYYVKVSYNKYTERKEGRWYVYSGTVEYYTNNSKDKFYFDKWPEYWPYQAYNNGRSYKKVSSAIINIDRKANKAPKGATFNIFFEGNAIGISGVN